MSVERCKHSVDGYLITISALHGITAFTDYCRTLYKEMQYRHDKCGYEKHHYDLPRISLHICRVGAEKFDDPGLLHRHGIYHSGHRLSSFLRHMINHRQILHILLENCNIVRLMLSLLSEHLIYSLYKLCLGRIIYPKIRENKTHSDHGHPSHKSTLKYRVPRSLSKLLPIPIHL